MIEHKYFRSHYPHWYSTNCFSVAQDDYCVESVGGQAGKNTNR